jgi:exopolyphosphatase/guanosine-5'-triphosphate,3'-diphosphate pyrophosphatase
MEENVLTKQTVAVIDIGSSAIRMVIAEVGPRSEIRYLENLQKPVRFGRDVFTSGSLSHGAIRDGVAILKDFKALLATYGVKTVHAIATSAVREAGNRDNFLDQVFVRTGIDVEVIEGPEENRLQLTAVEHALQGKFDLEKKNVLIIEVGSGSTELILLTQGRVDLTRTLPMGSIRLPGENGTGRLKPQDMQRVLNRNIREIAKHMTLECNLEKINVFVAMGGDMRFAARQIEEKQLEGFTWLDAKSFTAFVAKLAKLTPEETASKFEIPYAEAETLYPALLFYHNFLAETKTDRILVPMASIREGLLLETAQMLSGYKRTDLARQVVNSAKHLGEKYHYDREHASNVAALSLQLFDALKEDHGLGSRGRLLLETAAILHDIGTYLSLASHHKHAAYLVDAAEIFGLRKADKNIVSNVVRYHRRSPPKETHVAYMSLPKNDRAIVFKLSAILRVADALDRSHQQKVRDLTLERENDRYLIWVDENAGDLSIELEGLQKKNDMFNDAFGAPILLRQGVPPKK